MFRPDLPLAGYGFYHGRYDGRAQNGRSRLETTTRPKSLFILPPRGRRPAALVPDAGVTTLPSTHPSSSASRSSFDPLVATERSSRDNVEKPLMGSSMNRQPASTAPLLNSSSDGSYHPTSSYLGPEVYPTPSRYRPQSLFIVPPQRRQPLTIAQPSGGLGTRSSHSTASVPTPDSRFPEILRDALSARARAGNGHQSRLAPSIKPTTATPPAPTTRPRHRTFDAESSSSTQSGTTTPMTPDSSSTISSSPAPITSCSQVPPSSKFPLLLEIADNMPTTAFLARLANLHVGETPQERRAGLDRYREWMMLSPETRMEITGTSVDPVNCYGAVRVVGEWRWEGRVRREEEEGEGGKGKGRGDMLEDGGDDEDEEGGEGVGAGAAAVAAAGAEEVKRCARCGEMGHCWGAVEREATDTPADAPVARSRYDRWARAQAFSQAWS